MSTQTTGVGREYVRRIIRQTVRTSDGRPTRGEVVEAAAAIADASERVVDDEFGKLVDAGFVYDRGVDEDIEGDGVVLA